jgi:assimilatory nitrate reductase catalytic subunit
MMRNGVQGVHTTCPYCGVGCGVVATPDGAISGDAEHPSNRGRLCSKGAALALTLDDTDRLTEPRINGQPARWDTALDLIAARFSETIAAHGPDSVAFYVSGQCLTEDYYVANKLMKGFIGSGNIDTNSRLCMASSVAGHVRAFGEDVVPGVYDDWDEADLVVLVGSNTAWCHPVLHQRLQAARAVRGTKVVVIDPRRTATAEEADLHLPLKPGTDVLLFNGLLAHLASSAPPPPSWPGLSRPSTHHRRSVDGQDKPGHDGGGGAGEFLDHDWIARHTAGFATTLAAARADAPDLPTVARGCDLDPADLARFYAWFAATPRTLTVYSQGVNQSVAGTDKVNAIINCHLATGRIGRPGAGPFSVTGQPNAMGGREVGGLANQLAAHLRFDRPEDVDTLRRFWNAPNLTPRPGLKAVDLFDAVLDGQVKAVWIVATNPAASMPRADRVRAALQACPFVVVSDCWPTDTTHYADVVLPAAGWGEKDGTVTSSERRISRQRRFRSAPGQARPDWWMFTQVARRMGWADAFAWDDPAAIFREHAALSGFENDGQRVFNLAPLARISDATYASMPPTQWPLPATEHRQFAHGGFPTSDRRARFIPVTWQDLVSGHPFVLNTGRVRDQWHTMTRTGLVPRLMTHTPEPAVALHPDDALHLGVAAGELARIETDDGASVLRVTTSTAQRRGEVFVPMHWTDAFASIGPIGRMVTARCDPHSGQPDMKATPARIARVTAHFHGMLLRRKGGKLPALCHWTRVPLANGQLYRLTGTHAWPQGAALDHFAAALFGMTQDAEWIELEDPARGVLRRAALVDGVLEACLLLARDRAALPPEDSIAALLGTTLPPASRWRALTGGAATGGDPGPRICACFGVGRETVRRAAIEHCLRDVAAIGARLNAGTNCGSCIPELQQLLRDVQADADGPEIASLADSDDPVVELATAGDD